MEKRMMNGEKKRQDWKAKAGRNGGNSEETRKNGRQEKRVKDEHRKDGVGGYGKGPRRDGKNERQMGDARRDGKNERQMGDARRDGKNERQMGDARRDGKNEWQMGDERRTGNVRKGAGRHLDDKRDGKGQFGENKGSGERSYKGKQGRVGTLSREQIKCGEALCPVYGKCGGCQLLHLPYNKQLELKRKRMEELLKGLCPVKTIIGMEQPFHYRNKVHAVFGHDRKGNPLSGVYQEGTHMLVPVERCLLEDEKADEIIGTIRGMLKSFKIRTFDEDTGYGLLRHVLVRRGFSTGEIMVVLVTASPIFPSKNNFVKALREKHPEITTIIQNINGRSTSMVLGDKEHILYGKGYIEDELCGMRFRISSKSFYQVNPVQTEVLYGKALELAGLTGKEKVLDAYCGIGTIGLIASRKAGEVIGVELNPDAVRDAIQNAKINGVKNAQFYCNDASRFITNMADKGETVDVVLMDPPRSGSTKEFIDAVVKMGPKRVVYVSCGPESLARDLRVFKENGYRAVEGWGVDMFGGTEHVEVVIMMTYCGSDKKNRG